MQKLHIESVQVQNSIFLTLGRIDGLNDATKFECSLIQDVRNLFRHYAAKKHFLICSTPVTFAHRQEGVQPIFYYIFLN